MAFWQNVDFWVGFAFGVFGTFLFWFWSITVYRMGGKERNNEEVTE